MASDGLTSFKNGVTELGAGVPCTWGPSFPVGGNTVDIPIGEVFCEDTSVPLGPVRAVSMWASRLALVFGVAFVFWRVGSWVMGRS